MTEVIDPRFMEMNRAFPSFPNLVYSGERVFIAQRWLENAITGVMLKRLETPAPTLRVLEIAPLSDALDS